MASATINFDLAFSREYFLDKTRDEVSLRPNLLYRSALGYNSKFWNLSITWVGNRIAVKGESSDDLYLFRTGNLRLTLAKRITPGPKTSKYLRFLDPKTILR